MSKLYRSLLWTAGLVVVAAACGDEVVIQPPPPPPPPPEQAVRAVSVAPDGATISAGATQQFNAAVTFDPGPATPTVAWSTTASAAVGSISSTGLFTSVATSPTTSVGVTATATLGTSSAGGSATLNIVAASECQINSVGVNPTEASLVVPESFTPAATVDGVNCTVAQLGVVWSLASPAGVVTVNATTGEVTAVAAGTAVVRATSTQDPTKSATVAVVVSIPDPATISITSITQGGLGAPINLNSVAGQIEVTLTIDRGERTLQRVDALIGGVVVASQIFAVQPAAPAGAPANAPVDVVLNVDTRQLQGSPGAFVPAILNGQKAIKAELHIVNEPTPTPSNAFPVVMNNSDAGIAPAALDPVSDVPSVLVGATTWFKGSLFTTFNYIAFSNRLPAGSTTALTAACGAQTSVVSDGSATPAGAPPVGPVTVTNTWDCVGVEASRTITGPLGTTWPAGTVGPDGSALVGPETGVVGPPVTVLPGYSTVGAEFCIDGIDLPCGAGQSRWRMITPTPSALPGPTFVDNVAPAVNVADDDGGNDCVGSVVGGCVAFQDTFDQQWINASYTYAGDISVVDGGVGVDAAATEIRLWDAGPPSCTGAVTTSGADLTETVASDGTPDGHQVCVFGADLLGNSATSGPSNFFGVDFGAPSVRIAGSTGATPSIAASTVPGVSATPNTTIFSIAAPFTATDQWGIEAQDDRSGFDQLGLVAGFPANQTMTVLNPANDPAAVIACGFVNLMPLQLSDFWVRAGHVAPTGAANPGGGGMLDCGTGAPGYFTFSDNVSDRAGNAATITRNYAIDQYAAPVLASIGASTPFYTPGLPANFFLFGSDDLEVIEADIILLYPGLNNGSAGEAVGPLATLTKPLSAIAGAARWDATLTNILAATAVIDPLWIGRVDRTCTGAAAPYAGCLVADGPTVSVDYNNVDTDVDAVFEDDDKNATSVGAVAYDVASQASGAVATGLLTAQTTPDPTEQWSTDLSAAALVTWAVVTPTGASVSAVWVTSSSLVPPYLDSASLATLDATGTTLIVCGAFPAPVRTDNGITRQFTYTLAKPTTGPCAAGVTWYAIGLKNAAALITQGQP